MYLTRIKIYVECAKEWRIYATDILEIDDYFEGPQGEDRIRFLCPRCRDWHDSSVIDASYLPGRIVWRGE